VRRRRAKLALEHDLEGVVKALEEDVGSRRQLLVSAQSRQYHAADSAYDGLEGKLAEALTQATYAVEAESNAVRVVEQLETLAGQELIRMERLRGCALAQRARCMDLEQCVEKRTAQTHKLSNRIQALEQRVSWSSQQAAHERNIWILKKRELDRNLDDVRSAGRRWLADVGALCQESAWRRDNDVKLLRTQFERQAAMILVTEEVEGRVDARARASSAPSGNSAASASSGARIASMRASLRRQEEDRRRQVREINEEMLWERQTSEAEAALHRRRNEELRHRVKAVHAELFRQEQSVRDLEARRKVQEVRFAEQRARVEVSCARQDVDFVYAAHEETMRSEAAVFEERLKSVEDDAALAEELRGGLRAALLVECEEAEAFHEEALEEQACQQRELLLLSGSACAASELFHVLDQKVSC